MEFRGFGGGKMLNSGCQLDFDLTTMAVVGILEVLPKLREFFRIADIASDIFDNDRPDAVVLVDFPGFNWHIAKRAKERGIPVFYYLPPQLWAWGSWRIKKMRRNVDHVLCNLPFEPEWYAARNVPVSYVGHPFFDEVAERRLDRRFIDQRRSYDGAQVAVLPGSRSREVKNIWPMQLAAIRELSKRHPTTRFLVACLKDQHCLWCREMMSEADERLNIEFFVGKTSEIIELADCSLMKSGSVSLEMMARGTPAVVVYHVSRALNAIGRRLVNVDSMTLPNLIAKRKVMPEFLAVGRATAETISQAIESLDPLIGDPDFRAAKREELQALTREIARAGASRTAAQEIVKQLEIFTSAAEAVSQAEASASKAAA